MKKIIAVAGLAILLLTGCGDSDTPDTPEDVQTSEFGGCLAGAPSWVISGGAEGGFTAVGAAPFSKAGMNFTRTAAMASARDEMARSMSIKVQNMMKDFTQATGIGDDEVVDRVTATVSKQVADQTLSGTRQANVWASPCDELYILIAVDNAEAFQNNVKNAVNNSYRNEGALWQQFQAQKAQDELDAAIMGEFGDFE